MLEELFDPVAAKRLRSCPCGAHVDTLCASLFELGYARPTIREKLRIVGRLSRWMAAKHCAIADLDEPCVEEFVNTERHNAAILGERRPLGPAPPALAGPLGRFRVPTSGMRGRFGHSALKTTGHLLGLPETVGL